MQTCKIIWNSSLSPKLCQDGVGISVVRAKCQPFPRMQHMEKEKAHNLITSPYKMKLYADLQNYVKLLSPPEYLSGWGGEISSKNVNLLQEDNMWQGKRSHPGLKFRQLNHTSPQIWMLRLTCTLYLFHVYFVLLKSCKISWKCHLKFSQSWFKPLQWMFWQVSHGLTH